MNINPDDNSEYNLSDELPEQLPDDFEMTREMRAILIVLYEVYPEGLSEETIESTINERGLLTMSDEDFKTYCDEVFEYKKYIDNAKWN